MNFLSFSKPPAFNASKWRGTCFVAAMCLLGPTSFSAKAQQLQPSSAQPVDEHRAGKFTFSELPTPDLAGAKHFYGGLFGWTFRDQKSDTAPFSVASMNGVPVACLMQRTMPTGRSRQPAWLSILEVVDLEASRKLAMAQGARMLAQTDDRPGCGRLDVFADPQGAVFGVMSSGQDASTEIVPPQGAWIWHTLFTRDHDAAVTFYQNLFDYEVFPAPQADTTTNAGMQTILASGGYARASANGMPPSWSRVHPHWLGYIRVADASKTAVQAVALGGSILLQPRMDRHGGKLAVVADPQGAPIGLLEWTDDLDSRGTP